MDKMNLVNKVIEHLSESRELLNNIMYASDKPLSDEECMRYRSCYDCICLALDRVL